MRFRLISAIIALSLSAVTAAAEEAKPDAQISALPFDKLGDIEVTTVSKQPENSFRSAAAIYVLTSEMIKRSGATSVPEALRYVPGIEVQRIDSNRWAITSRGFNRELANKLLVMVDGRSVYNPLFAGTYWDAEDLLLENIDRIEVQRGPGATLWGANAVNGVINIITKDTKFTQGDYVSTGFGTFEKNITEARHGGKLSEDTYYRASAKFVDQGPTRTKSGNSAQDPSMHGLANWRMDWNKDPETNVMMVVNANSGVNSRRYLSPTDGRVLYSDENFKGINSTLRWQNYQQDNNSQLQLYVDYTTRDTQYLLAQENLTFDLDWQHENTITENFNVIWGLGYRRFRESLESDRVDGITLIGYDPDESYNNLYSTFVQANYSLIPKELKLTVGSKFEHNSYTGFNYQPSVRMSWIPAENQTVWGAVSRAVRVPTVGERSISLVVAPISPGNYLRAIGNPDVDAEELTAYELGYRIEPYRWLMFDVTGFYNQYDHLRSLEVSSASTLGIENKLEGDVRGIEALARVQANPDLMLQFSYSFTDLDLVRKPGSTDTLSMLDNGASPRNSFSFLTRYNLQENLYLDANFSTRSELAAFDISDQARLDMTLTWRPQDNVEFSLTGQNLTDDHHAEFKAGTFSIPSEIPRSVFGKVSVTF